MVYAPIISHHPVVIGRAFLIISGAWPTALLSERQIDLLFLDRLIELILFKELEYQSANEQR